MKRARFIVLFLFVAIWAALLTGVFIQWYNAGVDAKSLILAAVFYTALGSVFWYATDRWLRGE